MTVMVPAQNANVSLLRRCSSQAGRGTQWFDTEAMDKNMARLATGLSSGEDEADMIKASSKAAFYEDLYMRLCQLVRSDAFEIAIGCVIIVNTVTIALEAQYNGELVGASLGYDRQHPPAEWMKVALDAVNDLLLAIFTMELIAKVVAFGRDFFRGRNRYWNFIDFFVVAFGLLERFSNLDFGLDPMILRLLRLIKLTRFVKLFKTLGNSLQTMMLILKSVAAAKRTLFWSMLLLFIIQYVVGMIAGQLSYAFIENEDNDRESRKLVYKYYGTFTKTQLTMFEITHVNYAMAVRVLVDNISEWFGWFFVLYRCTIAFAFLAVIRAVFIQSTLKVAEQDKDLLMAQKKKVGQELEARIRDIFHLLFGHLADEQGFEISREEFLKVCKEDETMVWMAALDIDISWPEGLFRLMDLNGGGGISIEECIYVAKKVRGPAQAIDLYFLHAQVERIEAKLDVLLPRDLRGETWPVESEEKL
jgi:hypothetical protein